MKIYKKKTIFTKEKLCMEALLNESISETQLHLPGLTTYCWASPLPSTIFAAPEKKTKERSSGSFSLTRYSRTYPLVSVQRGVDKEWV
jgi:hypothetical protein